MFQFPGLPSPRLCVRRGDDGTSAVGFSHSGTPGSRAVCASPGTIAACRALRRLPAPRHPPCALHILPPHSGGGAMRLIPCFSMYDMMDVAIGSGGTPLAGRRHSRFVVCRSSHSLSDRKDLLKVRWRIDFENRLVSVGGNPPERFLLAMRLSRYAGRTPGTGYRGRGSHRGTGGLLAPGAHRNISIESLCFLRLLPRKEVIQPHVPVRLPCYDFTPLALHTFDASPRGAVGPAASGADDSGGVTGGVYKARERIHRGMLIRDY